MISFFFFAYVLVLIWITFFPVPIDPELIKFYRLSGDAIHQNWVPFSTISSMLNSSSNNLNSFLNLIGNILLFTPFSFLLLILNRKLSVKVIPLGILVILIIEMSQLLSSYLYRYTYRIFDVDDIILNTISLLIGVILFRVFRIIIKNNTVQRTLRLDKLYSKSQ
ncbi:VanZ family protein [Paenibacillus sp. Marseille-Q7038]